MIAKVALGISLVTLAWQFANYLLSGPRLKVELILAVQDSWGTVVRSSRSVWAQGKKRAVMRHDDEMSIELLIVRVKNVGRLPLTVSDVSLDFGASRRIAGKRATVRPHPLKIGETDEKFRLESRDFVEVFFDFWPMLNVEPLKGVQGRKQYVRRVRGSVAGVRRLKRSSLKSALHLSEGQRTFRDDLPYTRARLIYEEIVRQTRASDASATTMFTAPLLAREIATVPPSDLSLDRIEQLVTKFAVQAPALPHRLMLVLGNPEGVRGIRLES